MTLHELHCSSPSCSASITVIAGDGRSALRVYRCLGWRIAVAHDELDRRSALALCPRCTAENAADVDA